MDALGSDQQRDMQVYKCLKYNAVVNLYLICFGVANLIHTNRANCVLLSQ